MSYLNPSSVAGGTDRLDRSDVLVVDLDDTLVKTDIFVESSIRYLAGNVLRIFRFVLALLKGRSSAKSLIARSIRLDPSVLPYNHELLSYIEANYVTPGAKVILATATNQTFAHQIADHLGIFDGVIGSTDTANMKGKRKLVEIKKLVGENTWTYAGDSSADLPIWEKADRAITVNAPRRIEKRLSESGKVEKTFNRGHSMIVAFIRSLRVHQWSKNALIFVPLVASHSLHAGRQRHPGAACICGVLFMCVGRLFAQRSRRHRIGPKAQQEAIQAAGERRSTCQRRCRRRCRFAGNIAVDSLATDQPVTVRLPIVLLAD